MTKCKFVLACVLVVEMALCSCAVQRKPAAAGPAYAAPLNEGVRETMLSDMERDVVRQLNDLRANPKGWADRLRDAEPRSHWYNLLRQDGSADGIKEAALFLQNEDPLPPFTVSAGLCRAARDLLKDLGPKGLTGHRGSDGSTTDGRIGRYGGWEGKWAEDLIYGYGDAADRVLIGLLTEGGSEGWNQRNNIFDKDLHVIGVACGAHHVYRDMCVIDFAEKYTEAP